MGVFMVLRMAPRVLHTLLNAAGFGLEATTTISF